MQSCIKTHQLWSEESQPYHFFSPERNFSLSIFSRRVGWPSKLICRTQLSLRNLLRPDKLSNHGAITGKAQASYASFQIERGEVMKFSGNKSASENLRDTVTRRRNDPAPRTPFIVDSSSYIQRLTAPNPYITLILLLLQTRLFLMQGRKRHSYFFNLQALKHLLRYSWRFFADNCVICALKNNQCLHLSLWIVKKCFLTQQPVWKILALPLGRLFHWCSNTF